MKRNFIPLNEAEFSTLKTKCILLSDQCKSTVLAFGVEFAKLDDDAKWSVTYHLRNKFSSINSFNSVARFFCKVSYNTYVKEMA